MKTRKYRKWYQLNGMLRAGKFEEVIETPFVIYFLCPTTHELKTLATGKYCVICSSAGPSVDKKTAKITGKYKSSRLYLWAGVSHENAETVRIQLNSNLRGCNESNYY